MNRIIDQKFLLGDQEKDYYLALVRKVEGFTGVRVLNYCLMCNHVHLLLEVDHQDAPISEREVFDRMESLYSADQIAEVRQTVSRFREQGHAKEADAELDRFRSRMYDLGAFMKTVHQRFSIWYNRKHSRSGPLWNDRYKSVLIEPPAHYERPRGYSDMGDSALFAMCAYIDLNPLRAGMVEDPKDYRWCGYAEAVAGGKLAREGLMSVMVARGCEGSWRGVSRVYRKQLFAVGDAYGEEGVGAKVAGGQDCPPSSKDHELTVGQMVQCRVRYFTQGLVIGSEGFVEEQFAQWRDRLGLRREVGARKMKGGQWGGWCSMRHVQGDPVA